MFSKTCLERRKDGGWGWVVAFACLISHTLLGGLSMSSGLFYVMFRNAIGSSPVETSWLCALPMALLFYSSPLGCFLTNKYGFRNSAFIGGALAGIGLSLGYFAPSIGFLFFSHGILTGVGFGINYTATMTAVNVYFDKYKTVATGVISIGINGGLVIYASFLVFLDETYGWRGSMLILGATIFHMCVFALLLFPLTNLHELDSKLTLNTQENGNPALNTTEKHQRKYINLSVFRNSAFVCFCLSNIMVNTGLGVYILHIPSYLKENGFTLQDTSTFLAVYGITNVLAKVVYSVLGQHPRIDIMILYSTSLTAAGVCIVLTPLFVSRVGMLTLGSLVGFFSCVTGALLAAVIFRIVGFDKFADGVGMSLPFKASGNLIGGPLAGFLYQSTGDYSSSFYLGGTCMVISSLMMIPPVIKHLRDEKHLKSEKNEIVCEQDVGPLAGLMTEMEQAREKSKMNDAM